MDQEKRMNNTRNFKTVKLQKGRNLRSGRIYIYYFVTCETSDVTMSTTCMNVICSN